METVVLIEDDPEMNKAVVENMADAMTAYWASMGITLVPKAEPCRVQSSRATVRATARIAVMSNHM